LREIAGIDLVGPKRPVGGGEHLSAPARSAPTWRPPARSDPRHPTSRGLRRSRGRGASRRPPLLRRVGRSCTDAPRRRGETTRPRRMRLRPSPALAGPHAAGEGSPAALVARGPPRGRGEVHMGGCAPTPGRRSNEIVRAAVDGTADPVVLHLAPMLQAERRHFSAGRPRPPQPPRRPARTRDSSSSSSLQPAPARQRAGAPYPVLLSDPGVATDPADAGTGQLSLRTTK
jgi:hypothetical protein